MFPLKPRQPALAWVITLALASLAPFGLSAECTTTKETKAETSKWHSDLAETSFYTYYTNCVTKIQ